VQFKMTHNHFENNEPEYFDEDTAPDWLTSTDSVKGSTMDSRWFWNEHVLTLEVGQTIETDFRTIKRLND
jgi:hypothetical protein